MKNPTPRVITLTPTQRTQLQSMQKKGTHKARELLRARVLLKSHDRALQQDIAHTERINRSTVRDICDRFTEGGLTRALYDAPRSGQPRKLNDKAEAHLVALACSTPPEGRDHWTLELLQQQMITDKKVKTISTVALMHYLHKSNLKPWREKNVVRPETYA